MLRNHLADRGLEDAAVLSAMARVPREKFVPAEHRHASYDDRPLPLPCGQTISQPFVVALMSAALRVRPGDRVLEIGTGSGYQTAVLCEMGVRVWSVERHPRLAESARARLERLGYRDVEVSAGDGSLGLAASAPFDGILVAAAAPRVPPPLSEQLAPGKRLVIPVGSDREQELLCRTRAADGSVHDASLGGVAFVPLVGTYGRANP